MADPESVLRRVEQILTTQLRSTGDLAVAASSLSAAHLEIDDIARFVEGEPSIPVASHLLVCSGCRERVAAVLSIGEPPEAFRRPIENF